jgi:hypothetical protein
MWTTNVQRITEWIDGAAEYHGYDAPKSMTENAIMWRTNQSWMTATAKEPSSLRDSGHQSSDDHAPQYRTEKPSAVKSLCIHA